MKKQLLFVLSVVLYSYPSLAGSLVVYPTNRKPTDRVQYIQLPSGAKISYQYVGNTKKVSSKKLENFQILSSKPTQINVSNPNFVDDSVIRETFLPAKNVPTMETLLSRIYPKDFAKRFNATYLIWARQKYNLYANKFAEGESQIYSNRIPADFIKIAKVSKDKVAPSEYSKIIPLLVNDAKISRVEELNLRSVILQKQLIPLTISSDPQIAGVMTTINTGINRIKNCNPSIGNVLDEKLRSASFVFDETASQFLKSFSGTLDYNGEIFRVSVMVPGMSEKINMSPWIFKGYDIDSRETWNSFTNVADTRLTYFGNASFDVAANVGGKSFQWLEFTLVHEYGHILQSRLKDFIWNDRLFDIITAQRIGDGKIKGLDTAFTAAVKNQILTPFNNILETSATYFAMDAMVSCM